MFPPRRQRPSRAFERNRNQVIYSQFQHNRNPFADHPEWVWPIFMNQTNDSQISIAGTTPAADGSSTKTIDLGRVFTSAGVPGGAKCHAQ
jgi:hypothetical protein